MNVRTLKYLILIAATCVSLFARERVLRTDIPFYQIELLHFYASIGRYISQRIGFFQVFRTLILYPQEPKSRKKFFIPVRILSRVFRGKLLAFIQKEHSKLHFKGSADQWSDSKTFTELIRSLYQKEWVVYCKKPFKKTGTIVQYLSRYTHKTAIYNNRLTDMNDQFIRFRYRDYKGKNKVKVMSLTGEEFIRRFLLHVLPSGFQKIRYYGLLCNRYRKLKLSKCFKMLRLSAPEKVKYTSRELMLKVLGKDISVCPHCGGTWVRYESILPLPG